MNTVVQYIKGMFGKKDTRVVDPVYEFFVNASPAEKRRVYGKALRAADLDQKKILAEYKKRFEPQAGDVAA